MRTRVWAAGLLAFAVAGCTAGTDAGEPPPAANDAAGAPSPSREERLAALRATDQFDEFAEHGRAAQADGARLAWENFAPIVDGERVEWTNKAELWDSIAPRIRDEALLLGPEYREPLWDNTNAIPNGVSMAWNNEDTEGRGDYVEFSVTYQTESGPAERYWAYLVSRDQVGRGSLIRRMPAFDILERDHPDLEAATEELRSRTWSWLTDGES